MSEQATYIGADMPALQAANAALNEHVHPTFQQVLNTAFDAALDYISGPVEPLTPEQVQEWREQSAARAVPRTADIWINAVIGRCNCEHCDRPAVLEVNGEACCAECASGAFEDYLHGQAFVDFANGLAARAQASTAMRGGRAA